MADPQTLQESNIVVEHLSIEYDEFKKIVLETLSRIEAQTTKTNGRVNRLEGWQAGVLWAGAGILTLGAYVLYVYDLNIDMKVDHIVAQRMSVK